MGSNMSSKEKHVYDLMSKLLEKQGRSVASPSLKLILRWVESYIKGLSPTTAFSVELWDEVGMKLWDKATKGNRLVADLLPIWRAILETLRAQEAAGESQLLLLALAAAPLHPPPCCAPLLQPLWQFRPPAKAQQESLCLLLCLRHPQSCKLPALQHRLSQCNLLLLMGTWNLTMIPWSWTFRP